ncbi:hypothetical protein F5Y10DRAFT_42340 [Nemania abortiva]|nr:hypothetical protein F5Y10DRAFT_42340 [Nemania abortiva]
MQTKEKREPEIARDVVHMAGPPPTTRRALEYFVIIPRWRPRNKHRGFVRAYAPVLAESGISHEVFLRLTSSLSRLYSWVLFLRLRHRFLARLCRLP